MNVVMIIPTGIGCEIGGHAGDATPAARLIGSCCDKLFLHPNVVNASDINEMPGNALYIEGSILDRFLEGSIQLEEVKQNKILVIVNKPVKAETVNAVSASRSTLGIDATILNLEEPLRMIGFMKDGIATGTVSGVDELIEQIKQYEFDALAIASLIEVPKEVAEYYWKNGGVNPWGGVEAMASKMIAERINKPVAHAPVEPEHEREKLATGWYDFVCDPRVAAEIISECYLHCVLKGLHKAPRIGKGLSVDNIDVMVSPKCWGRPHDACEKANIPIIIVSKNKTVCDFPYGHHDVIFVKNYFEAVGIIKAMEQGITLESIRRPLKETEVING